MSKISLFEEKQVRRTWGTNEDKWMFANVDVTAILTDSPNPQVYRCVMKKRLSDEGNQTVTNCHGLKMTATVGKQRMTDIADTEQLLRLIRSVPSPKAVPFKRWLAKVGYERLEEIENPELAASYREGFQLTSWPPNRIPAPDPQPSEGAQSADSSTVPQTRGGSSPRNPPLFLPTVLHAHTKKAQDHASLSTLNPCAFSPRQTTCHSLNWQLPIQPFPHLHESSNPLDIAI
jgi:hypothetical protein